MHLAICGGDARAAWLAKLCAQRGAAPKHYGLERAGLPEEWKGGADAQADILVFPVPWGREGRIQTPLGTAMDLDEALAHGKAGGRLVCGAAGADLEARAKAHKLEVVDVLKREDFLVRNAALTAEGAIHSVCARMESAIEGMRCAVLGYGRIGRHLARLLSGIGARPAVFAVGEQERSAAENAGHEAHAIEDLAAGLIHCPVVFGTIPKLTLTGDALLHLPEESLLCDLASAPGGIDLDAANRLGHRAWSEPGLPGRYCPKSAAALMLPYVLLGSPPKP